MQLRVLQHVPFEGPGHLQTWADQRGWMVRTTRLDLGDPLPDPGSVDLLVVLGGPMSVHDQEPYPWLGPEKAWLAMMANTGKPLLGICLGAQLLACVLGASVRPNPVKEIGWWPIRRHPGAGDPALDGWLPEALTVFHWHGETFDLPAGAVGLAGSEACANQIFRHGSAILGLQCHLETTPEAAALLIEHGREELVAGGPFLQSENAMLANPEQFRVVYRVMERLLDHLAGMA